MTTIPTNISMPTTTTTAAQVYRAATRAPQPPDTGVTSGKPAPQPPATGAAFSTPAPQPMPGPATELPHTPSHTAALAPPMSPPRGWPQVPVQEALRYVTALAARDRAAALDKLIDWGPQRSQTAKMAAMLRGLLPKQVQHLPCARAWLCDRFAHDAPPRAVAWLVGAVPAAVASALGLVDDAQPAEDATCGEPLRDGARLDRDAVVALLRTPVSEHIARAWARTVCSTCDDQVVTAFIDQVPTSPWHEHRAAMAEALPDYTRRLMGPHFEGMLKRWQLPASLPAKPATLGLLKFLLGGGPPRDRSVADAFIQAPYHFVGPGDFEAWTALMQRVVYAAGPEAKAHLHLLLSERGEEHPVSSADVLQALLRRLPDEGVAALRVNELGGVARLNAADLLSMAHRLRALHPQAFAALAMALHREGTEAQAADPAQQAALDSLLACGAGPHRNKDLLPWAARIEKASPRLAVTLRQLNDQCKPEAPGWDQPIAQFRQAARALGTAGTVIHALTPLLQAMVQSATPEEATQRAKTTLRVMASPIASDEDLRQLQALPQAFTDFSKGAPLTPACSPQALAGLSPLLRDWLLMATHARLQHAKPSAEIREFVNGCAEHRDHSCASEALDWLELAQRMQADLLPWWEALPLPPRCPPKRDLQRWTAVLVRSASHDPGSARCNLSWLQRVYAQADLATLLALEACVAEHWPEQGHAARVELFKRSDLHPTPAQQRQLEDLFARLPDRALFDGPRINHALDLAPLATRRFVGRWWLLHGQGFLFPSLPDDMVTLQRCLDKQPTKGSASELRLLADVAPQVAAADWQALLTDHGDPAWLSEVLYHEKPCVGQAAHSQANRLAALGQFLHICRVLQVPRPDRDAVGALVKQLLALPDVKARQRLLCRLGEALLPRTQIARDDVLALAAPSMPSKAIPLQLAARLYLPRTAWELPQLQALLGTRATYGDGNLLRQLLQGIMNEDSPDYAVAVLAWARRGPVENTLRALRARATPEQHALFNAVGEALRAAPADLDMAFYKQKCVRTFLNAYVLPLQCELIACADVRPDRCIDLGTVTSATELQARLVSALGISEAVFAHMQRQDATLRYALGFRGSQTRWPDFKGRDQVPQLLRELLLATADGSLDAYRRQAPQAKRLLGQPGGEALLQGWEQAPPPEAVAWPPMGFATSSWSITDTGRPTQQLAAVTDIPSCQSNNSSMGYNYGMLGRMACGSKRTLTLRDERGTLRARAALRLVLDEADRPVLLMSNVYLATGVERWQAERMLDAYTARRAKALGVPALHSDGDAALQTVHTVAGLPDYWDEDAGIATALKGPIRARKLT